MGTGNLIVIDIETTGLDVYREHILEVAALPVDKDLQPLHHGLSIVVNPNVGELQMVDRVRQMHTDNGLLVEVAYGSTPGIAAQTMIDYISQYAKPNEIPMTGSSIHFDRKFLERYMPTFEKYFHYRCIDISTVKELFKRWFPGQGEPPKKNEQHRALGDCYSSLEELRWYRQRLAIGPSYAPVN